MRKRIVLILSFLLALLVSVGAAIWVIVYQTQVSYPTELSGKFSLEISYDTNLLTASNGQVKGDLIKKGIVTGNTSVTTLYVKHELGDKTYKYPIHQAATTSLNNTEFEYGVASGENATFKFTESHSLLTAQNTTPVAVKILLGGNSNVNSDVQKFLRALIQLPAPDAEGADESPATFDRGGVSFKVTSNYVSAAYVNATATMQAIAYNGSNNYGTIEGALGASTSGSTVYVKPQTTVTLTTTKVGDSTVGAIGSVKENTGVPQNPYIIKNCTIASGVTLCLPWEGTKAVPATETVQSHESLVSHVNYPVANLTSGNLDSRMCTNHVTMQANVTLTNLGTLVVGGIVNGSNGGSAASYSANQYAKLTLKANAKIINGKLDGSVAAAIQCYGYILEDTTKNGSQIILYGKSSYISPFKVMEHRGGTVFSDMAGGSISNPQLQCAPFNRFYMPNSSVEMTFHYNSSLYGYADLYTNKKLIFPAQHNITTIKMFGTSDEHLLKFANSSTYVVTKYDPATEIHDVDVYGSSALNSLSLVVDVVSQKLPLSTKSVYFPLSWHFDISFFKGNETTATFTSASQMVKLLTGASVTIGAGVNATLPSIVVYDTFTDTYSTTTGLRYENKPSAKLTVNGSLTVDSFGGPIETKASKTALTVNTATSITSKEVIDGKTYQEITKTLALPKYANASQNYTSTGTYYSAKRSDNTYGWYSANFKITYDENGGSAVEDTNVELKQGGGYTFTETFLSSKVTTREHYTFSHWCTQDNCTNGSTCANKASGRTVYGDTTLYAAWTKNKYKLNYVYVVPDGDGVKEIASGISPTEFTIDTTTITLNNTPTAPTYTTEGGETKSYNFSGWFTAAQNGERISAIIVEDYRDLAVANGGTYGQVTIYALWTKDIIYTVKFNNSHGAAAGGYDITDATTVKLDDNGNGTLTTPDKATDGQTLLTAHNDKPTDKMYFDGWYIDAAKTIRYTDFAQLKALVPADGENYERTLYAKWLEKATVNTLIDSTTAFVGYYLPNTQVTTPAAPTKTGYIFTHWSIPVAGNVLANTAFTLEGVSYGGSVNLTAVFEKLVTVTVNLNGGTATYATTQYVRAGESYTAPAKPTKTGYKFTGWTVTGGPVSSLAAGAQAVISSDIGGQVTLTAQYEQQVKITINLNGGTASYATTQYVDAGASYTAPAKPTKTSTYGNGWTFTSWTVTGGSVSSLTASQSAIISSTPGAQVTLTANYNPTITITGSDYSMSNKSPSFNSGDTLSAGTTLTFKVSANSNYKLDSVKANGATLTANNGVYSVTVNEPTTIEVSTSWSGCLVEGTLITLADGRQKPVEDLQVGDMVITFNHFTGEYQTMPIAMNVHETETAQYYAIANLHFSNNTVLRTAKAHGLFDVTLNKYVYLSDADAHEYIGHTFYATKLVNGEWVGEHVVLESVSITNEYVKIYAPLSATNVNLFAEGLLTTPPRPFNDLGYHNHFEFGDNLKYDEEQMQADIEQYGLYTYEDFAQYVTREQFELFPFTHLKIAVGKGMMTHEELIRILQFMIENS